MIAPARKGGNQIADANAEMKELLLETAGRLYEARQRIAENEQERAKVIDIG